MQEKKLWNEVLDMFNTSNKNICIYEGIENVGNSEIETVVTRGIDKQRTEGIVWDEARKNF